MDHLPYVMRLFAFVFGMVMASMSFASSCPSSYYAISNLGSTKSWSGPVTSNDIYALTYACAQLDARYQAAGNTSTYNGSLVGTCGYWASGVWNSVGGTSTSVGLAKWFQGPSGQWVSTDPGTCTVPTCPTGQSLDPSSNTCTCDIIASVGGQMVSGDVETGCMGGCTIRLRSGWYDKAKNVTWGYDWAQNGSKCTVADAPVISSSDSKVQEASKCAAGTCPGIVNGQSVCVACTAPKETTTMKDTTTQVNTPVSGASSASSSSSSSSSTTKCAGDACTTTTTTTTVNPDGSKSDKTTMKQEPIADFCTDNPRAAMCKDGGTWGGSCGSFTCDGDAVQCATAKAVQQSQCDSHIEQNDPMVTAGINARTSDFSRGDPRNGGSVDVTSFDQTERYAGSCPTDPVIAVMGKSITVPLSRGCTYLGWLGQAAVAVCLIAAARIALGGA